MVKGLDLSLFDMCVGERRRIEIPARLAYGNKGSKVFGIPPEDGTVRVQEESPGQPKSIGNYVPPWFSSLKLISVSSPHFPPLFSLPHRVLALSCTAWS